MFIRRMLPVFAVGLALVLAGRSYAAKPCDVAITHVSVIPMTHEAILRERTVLVQGGRIAAIVKAGARPDCREVIDGRGQYLLPGLNDLHVHLPSEAFARAFGATARPTDFPSALAAYVASGVTGVRVMSGSLEILAFRNAQRATASRFPRLIVASPMMSGDPPVIAEPITRVVTTPDAARSAVDEFAAAGYDLIKVRDNLKAPVFRAIIEEARRRGLYVDGHMSQGQGLSAADVLQSGEKAIAHIDNFALDMKTDADAERYAKLMVACDCFVSTTLEVEHNAVQQITAYDAMIGRAGVRYVDPLIVSRFWAKPNNGYLAGKADPAFFRELLLKDGILLRTFTKAGVHVVAGTDALNPMILPGESLHDELADMVTAGLTPYEALKTATINPALYVPGFEDVGQIAPGKAANLLLASSNPLTDLTTLRTPKGVMINGHWFAPRAIQHELERAAAHYAAH